MVKRARDQCGGRERKRYAGSRGYRPNRFDLNGILPLGGCNADGTNAGFRAVPVVTCGDATSAVRRISDFLSRHTRKSTG